jgi:hypothetical protein
VTPRGAATLALSLVVLLAARAAEAQDDKGGAKPVRESQAEHAAQASVPEDDDADVHTEGDTKVKEMEFSGLDIEGELKTPQMLLFLNRLRAEFGRPRLPHRSFMPELQRSTRGKSF